MIASNNYLLNFVLDHVPFVTLMLALITGSLIVVIRGNVSSKLQNINTFIVLIMIVAISIPCIWNFMVLTFLLGKTKHVFSWHANQLEYGLAVANLTVGLAALCSYKASKGFRLATTLVATCFFWGLATSHLYQTTGMTSISFYSYLSIPIVLMILMAMYCKRARNVFIH